MRGGNGKYREYGGHECGWMADHNAPFARNDASPYSARTMTAPPGRVGSASSYSTLMPACLMSGHHLSISAL